MFRSLFALVLASSLAAVPLSFLKQLHADEPSIDAGTPTPTVVRLNEDIEGKLEGVLGQLALAKDDVTLVITSEGGSVAAGMEFILAVEDLRAKNHLKVHCIADMYALSMAAAILESGACDDRAMTDRTLILFHGVQAPPSPLVQALNHSMGIWISRRMGMTLEAYQANLAKGDWILSAPAALEAHAIDRIITP